MSTMKISQPLVLVSKQNGLVVIPATPLTRLNYFDGKFLRAQDLKLEQNYLRHLVRQSNQAGGPGVAHGYDLTLGSGDTLNVGDGLAIDPQGRVLLLPQSVSVNIQDLIEKSRDVQQMFGKAAARNAEFEDCVIRSEDPPIEVHQAGDLFLIVISSAEAYCGEEDVYGKLCEEACATSTDRPYIMEGVTIRAIPLVLRSPLPNSRARSLTQVHYRSRVASAYFEDERKRVASLISKFGLEQQTWCLGADAAGGSGVAIGVIARAGSNTVFLDAWIARRERIDLPAKRYWQWRMMMRPWDVFIAQVLQFQCQLRDLFRKTPGGDDDPCGGARGVIHEAANTVADFRKFYEVAAERFAALSINLDEVMTFRGGLTRMTALNDKLFTVGRELAAMPRDEFLIRGGIVELPSAGYLPVTPSANSTINQQVRFLMGNGVDLRFCVVRPDYVAHALEEAQHMERISLLQGLDDPKNKPEVDILVPNGEIIEQKQLSPGTGLEAKVEVNGLIFRSQSSPVAGPAAPANVLFFGAARAEKLAANGGSFYLSCEHRTILQQQDQPTIVGPPPPGAGTPGIVGGINVGTPPPANIRLDSNLISKGTPTGGLWVSLRCDNDVFKLNRGDHANFNTRAIVSAAANKTPVLDVEFNGVLQIVAEATAVGMDQVVRGRVENAQLTVLSDATGGGTRQTSLVDLDVTLEMRGQSQITILLDHAQIDLVLSARWDKQPLEINAAILHKRRSANTTISLNVPLAEAVLKENADVLSATNASHVQALAGLKVVAATLSDPNFADAKARLLFPPPPKPIDEVLVRGTMDWVLFHRRRTKKCQIDVAPPPPAPPPRRYALWMGVAADEAAIREAGAALVNNRPFNREQIFFRRIDNVEFQSGLGTMISRPDDIEADWKQNNPGEKILLSAIASATANDGEPVAKDRIGKVEQAVAPISKVNGTARHVLSTVHQELTVAGTDGIIVMVTLRASVCHPVFLSPRPGELDRAVELLSTGRVQEAITQTGLVPLGVAMFKQNSADISDPATIADIKTKWAAQASGASPGRMVVVTAPGGHVDPTIPRTQARAIRDAIGVSTEPITPVETPVLPKAPIECPVFSMLLRTTATPPPPPQTRTARLLVQTQIVGGNRVFGATTSPLTIKFNADSTLAEGLSTAIISQIQPHIPNRIHAVEFAPQPAGEPNAGKRLDAIFTELGNKNLLIPAGANKKVVALQPAEQPLLTVGGVTADDVIFLLATATQVQTRNALVIFANADEPQFFPKREPELRARVVFLDNVPEGAALRALTRKQPTNTKVRAIHLAALTAPPAAGSDQRNRVVLEEVRANGSPSMTQGPTVGVLAQADRDRLLVLDPGILNGINEVIFLVLDN